jgi:hypothetical protein
VKRALAAGIDTYAALCTEFVINYYALGVGNSSLGAHINAFLAVCIMVVRATGAAAAAAFHVRAAFGRVNI